MDAFISPDWVELTREQFQQLLSNTCWHREGWSNGIRYRHSHSGKAFAFQRRSPEPYSNPKYYADPESADL